LQGFSNVLLATGHYRNGVLLAPATNDSSDDCAIMNLDFDFLILSRIGKSVSVTQHKIKVGSLEWFYRESSPIGRTDFACFVAAWFTLAEL